MWKGRQDIVGLRSPWHIAFGVLLSTAPACARVCELVAMAAAYGLPVEVSSPVWQPLVHRHRDSRRARRLLTIAVERFGNGELVLKTAEGHRPSRSQTSSGRGRCQPVPAGGPVTMTPTQRHGATSGVHSNRLRCDCSRCHDQTASCAPAHGAVSLVNAPWACPPHKRRRAAVWPFGRDAAALGAIGFEVNQDQMHPGRASGFARRLRVPASERLEGLSSL